MTTAYTRTTPAAAPRSPTSYRAPPAQRDEAPAPQLWCWCVWCVGSRMRVRGAHTPLTRDSAARAARRGSLFSFLSDTLRCKKKGPAHLHTSHLHATERAPLSLSGPSPRVATGDWSVETPQTSGESAVTPDTDRPGSRLCARFFIFTVYLVCRSLVLVALSVEAIDQSPQSQDRCK